MTVGRRNLTWRDHGDGLACRYRGRVMVTIEPDDRLPGMWRIRDHDGRLGNMTNITGAKDAAATIALHAPSFPTETHLFACWLPNPNSRCEDS